MNLHRQADDSNLTRLTVFMMHVEDQGGDRAGPQSAVFIRWRPWPCASCRGGSTALDFLVRGLVSNTQGRGPQLNEKIDWLKEFEFSRLLEWINACPHSRWSDLSPPLLVEDSEHQVLVEHLRKALWRLSPTASSKVHLSVQTQEPKP